MIIAQLTDLHIGFEGPDGNCVNTPRLKQALKDISQLRRQPDLMLVTGDLTEGGKAKNYAKLKAAMSGLPFPVHYLLGNHDAPDAFCSVFEDYKLDHGKLRYSFKAGQDRERLKIIMVNSLKKGRHGGAFDSDDADWLSAELQSDPELPALIALHHPPIETGIAWMSAQADAPWIKRLENCVKPHDHILQIISGHIHRTISQPFGGTLVTVSPAVAAQVKLEFDDIDPAHPDDRPLITDSPPGYSLHLWNGKTLTTHSEHSPLSPAIVNYDKEHAGIVPLTLDLKKP